MRRVAILTLGATLACANASSPTGDASSSGGTDSGSSGSTGGTTGSTDPAQEAIERGIAAAASLSADQPVLLLLMDVLYRRHGVDEFAGAAAAYDALLDAVADPPVDVVAFRRVFDPLQTLTAKELAGVAPGVNQITLPALYCDVVQPDAGYTQFLEEQAGLGGYELTHVALALHWAGELGCDLALAPDFSPAVLQECLALIDGSDGIDDLEVEAAAFCGFVSDPPAGTLEAVLSAQLGDGSWPRDPGDAVGTPHTTGLALLYLLEATRDPNGPFVAQ